VQTNLQYIGHQELHYSVTHFAVITHITTIYNTRGLYA